MMMRKSINKTGNESIFGILKNISFYFSTLTFFYSDCSTNYVFFAGENEESLIFKFSFV
jgi:hypothetical protein